MMDGLGNILIIVQTLLSFTDMFARDVVFLRHKGEWTREYIKLPRQPAIMTYQPALYFMY